ncbi:MAG: ATP-binding protein [Alphaproteobacteria bacterium]|nr:ATP-binding protein [Alphaproteobacteria bacterium]MDX5368471.1 ATP-binding protein [Alphaproteobacteria bacterium]MDX5463268.1 ATP-binding protein [Alphaproteobacteria bacterium]
MSETGNSASPVIFVVSKGSGAEHAAEQAAATLKRQLYRTTGADLIAPYAGETSRRVEHQIDIARRGNAILLVQRADTLFGDRVPERLDESEPMMDGRSIARRFADAGVPVVFALSTAEAAESATFGTGWHVLHAD